MVVMEKDDVLGVVVTVVRMGLVSGETAAAGISGGVTVLGGRSGGGSSSGGGGSGNSINCR